MEGGKTIDLTYLESFTSGDKEKMEKYIRMFLKYAPSQLSSIKNNLDKRNWNDLRLAAHTFKPQLMYMGIGSLENVILDIEHCAAQQKGLDRLPGLVNKLIADCELAMKELKEVLSVNDHS